MRISADRARRLMTWCGADRLEDVPRLINVRNLTDPADADAVDELAKALRKGLPVLLTDGEPEPDLCPELKGEVVRELIRLLAEVASEVSPLSHALLLKHLTVTFPGRSPKKMMQTIKNQVPSRLRVYRHLDVVRSSEGFWIEKRKRG